MNKKEKNKLEIKMRLPGKVLALDTETTGLDPYKNSIHQLAGICYNNHFSVHKFNLHAKPNINDNNIDPKALGISGINIEKLNSYQSQASMFIEFKNMLNTKINPFDEHDKMTIFGYNITFDINFLRRFFIVHNDKYYGAYFNSFYVDVLGYAYHLRTMNILNDGLPNYKLKTLCNYFDIPLKAHDAMNDITATIQVYNCLEDLERRTLFPSKVKIL